MSTFLRAGLLALTLATPFLSLPATADAGKAAGYYEDGLARFKDGDLDGSVIQLKNALQQDASMLAAQVLLARALLEQAEYPASEAAFNRAIELGVGRSVIAAPRARLLMALGRPKQLLADISADGLRGDDLVEVLTLRARAQALEGNADEAARGFEAAIHSDPLSVRPYEDLVPFLLQRGDLEGARRSVARLVEIAPDKAETWNLRASLAHAQGRLQPALEDYGKAISLDPDLVDARVARAAILVDLDRTDAAAEDLDHLAKSARKEPRSAYLRAVIAGRKGDEVAAKAALQQVATLVDGLPPEYTSANEQLLMLGALSHHGLGTKEKATEYLDILQKRFPRNLGGRKLLAAIYLDANDSARALAAIEPVLRDAPEDPQANLLAGRAQLGLNRHKQASDYLEKAVKRLGNDPQALAALGMSLLGRGMESAGIERLEQAMTVAPDRIPTGSVLITLYMQRGEGHKAVALAETMVRKTQRDPEAVNLLASVQAASGDNAAARDSYREVLARTPDYVPALLNLARVEAELGDGAGAQRRLEALLARAPDDPRPMFELGLLARRQGKTKEALDWLAKALAKRPDERRVALAIVETHSGAGQHAAALDAAKDVAIRYPDDLSVQAVLGQAFLAAGDARNARQVFRNMTRAAEFDVDAQIRIGRLALAAGFADDAAYNAQKALTAQAKSAPALELAIDTALARGQVETAGEFLQTLRTAVPTHAEVKRYQGTIDLAAGRHAAAVETFRKLHAEAPSTRSALNLSAALRQSGQDADAERVLRKEFEREPALAVLGGLADVQIARGQWRDARQSLERMAVQQPDDPGVLNRLALVLRELNDPAALATAERALALAPKDPALIDTVGWIKLHQGDVSGGLAMLRDARLRAPADPEIRYHLAVALERSGRTGEAREEIQAALDSKLAFHGIEDARALHGRLKN
ncbi:MAG: PEP-CTERM system TPR-repeat protein PrsT [Rhodocyclaceae bacterium]|nr:PEP-CTERM system TPR-repeat protein PrsT [Rhodocyclaceae bacterium]